MYNYGLGCSCSKCGSISNLLDSKVDELSALESNSKFFHDCPSCGPVEHILSKTEKERVDAAKHYPGPKDFVHLHNHTIYSSLDGVASPDEYFEGCHECNLSAFAITDHGSVAVAPDAYFASKKHNVKYISGCEIYFNDFEPEFKSWQAQAATDKITDIELNELKEFTKIGAIRAGAPEIYSRFVRNRHLTILAKNEIGYSNLIAIQNKAWETGFYYKPRVSYDLLKEHKDGLIIISGCLNGPLCHELRLDTALTPTSKTIRNRLYGTSKMDKNCYAPPKLIALEWLKQFKEDFGDDFYLEIQMPGEGIPNGRRAFQMIAEIGRRMNQKIVLTNDCHYTNREDFKIQMIMMAVAQDKKIDDPTLFHVNSDEQFFKTRAQMRKTFLDNKYDDYATIEEFEKYCDNTLEVAGKCSWFSPNLDPKLPEVDNADRELVKATYDALCDRGFADDPVYVDRMKLELQRFIEKKFSSYFLIMADIVNQSRSLGAPVGPARGSAGGSLVCYLLGIHEMDPIVWDLSFDRFLSPSRGGNMLATTM